MDELREFALWLNEYINQPIDPELYFLVNEDRGSRSAALELGHSYALVAVTGALKGLVEARTRKTPGLENLIEDSDFANAFRKLLCLREAGAGGSNPLTPTSKIKDIDVN